jgi:PAS domain S-box-containing protein
MKKLSKYNLEFIQELINCIKVGIFITDSKGNVVLLNDESEKTGGLSKDELSGNNMQELIDIGYVIDSSVIKVLESGEEEYIIQELGAGGELYITGVPWRRDDNLFAVVCTERDITETMRLRELLAEQEKKTERIASELEYLRSFQVNFAKDIISKSNSMKNIVEMAMRVAKRDATVMLKGESGTGKELIANLIHKNSPRKDGAFVKINCAAIPDNLLESELFGYEKGAFTGADSNGKIGLFELADNGTLFLDEIGELAMPLQSKLLRALQEKEFMRVGGNKNIKVDVRIITATNVDLLKAVEERTFREDLYYRLNIIPLDIPPLRRRKEDIESLAQYFVNLFNEEYNLGKVFEVGAIEELKKYSWPGNVRELRNIIERIMISFDGDEITKFQIDRQLNTSRGDNCIVTKTNGTLDEQIEEFEKNLITNLMTKHRNGSIVAKILGIDKSTISRKIKKYNIAY